VEVVMKERKTDVVRTGGVAKEPADTEDVSRDTYGDDPIEAPAEDRDERIAEADREAGSAGLPGVAIPASRESGRTAETRREQVFRRVEKTGDRVASRHDRETLRGRRGNRSR
jgi:hypothetical protein